MSETSPGHRIAHKAESHLKFQALSSAEVSHSLCTLQQILQSSFGSRGKMHLLHNNKGGHGTFTSATSRLLGSLSLQSPVVRLITLAIQGHLTIYSDGGKIVGLLALYSIIGGLQLNARRRLVVEIQDRLAKVALEYLKSETCPCKVPIDVSREVDTKKVVSSIVTSRPGCLLFGPDLAHITALLVDAFKKSKLCQEIVGSRTDQFSNGSHIVYVCREGCSPLESHVLEGVLFQMTDLPLNSHRIVESLRRTDPIRIALVNISMAGDSGEFMDVRYELEGGDPDWLEEVACERMMTWSRELIGQGTVRIVACQKVIHPAVKRYLQQHDVLVLDRLGLTTFTALSKLAGGRVSSTLSPLCDSDYGTLTSVTLHQLGDRDYVQLCGQGRGVCTVILCHRTEEALEELKEICQVAVHVLEQYLHTPWGLAGGGCWQTVLAHRIRQQTSDQARLWSKELGCSVSAIIQIADHFSLCLEKLSAALDHTANADHITDRDRGHHFTIRSWDTVGATCQCGAVSYPNLQTIAYRFLGRGSDCSVQGFHPTKAALGGSCTTVDCYQICVSAIQTAVNVSNMILGIENIVTDKN